MLRAVTGVYKHEDKINALILLRDERTIIIENELINCIFKCVK